MSKFSCGPWFVYIILCENNSLYTGIAKDPEKRFRTHLAGKGAKYTKIYKPICLVHCEEYTNHTLAAKRERQIKSYPVAKKQQLKNIL
ncbi:MAG: GIY-YIG nuclease family protein [Brevinema sp.]